MGGEDREDSGRCIVKLLLTTLRLWQLDLELVRLETYFGMASAFATLFVVFQWFMPTARLIAVYAVVVAAILALTRAMSKKKLIALEAAVESGALDVGALQLARQRVMYALHRLLCMSAIAVCLVAGVLSNLPGLRHQ